MRGIKQILLFGFCLFSFAGFAQTESSISGFVYDSDRHPIPYCTVSILASKDSSVITGAVSDESGFFKIGKIEDGSYIVKYAHLQYNTEYVDISAAGKLMDVTLQFSSIDLKEVIVTGNLIKERPGGYIVDISHNPFTRNKSSKETFALLPGVTANNEGLKINGNPVAKIYIDGKEASEKDLSNLRSNMIDKIEITNHAANRYQANVLGGVIHVKLKKLASGTFQLSGGGNAGVTFQEGFYTYYAYAITRSRYKKLSFINNLQYYDLMNTTKTKYEKDFLLRNQQTLTDSKENAGYSYVYEKVSLVYDINAKHNVGVSFKALLEKDAPTRLSHSITQTPESVWESTYHEKGKAHVDTYQTSLNYNWEIDSDGSNFSLVADFLKNKADNNRYGETVFAGFIDSTSYQHYDIHTPLDLFKAEAHLQIGLSSKSQLAVGGEYYYKKIDQTALYENKVGNEWLTDDNISDRFTYKEYGFGLYAGYTLSLKKWTIVPSFRLQMDQIETHSYKESANKRDYWNLFPSLLVSYQATDWMKVDANYKRGMNDIRYGLMNPKVLYTSDNTYTKGNPDLNPAMWNMFDLNTRWFAKWTLGYNMIRIEDGDRTVTLVDEHNPDVTYFMPVNMTKTVFNSIGAGYSTPICKWWYINLYASYRRKNMEYDGYKRISSRFSYSFYNSFEFGRGFSGNLSFNGETKEYLDEEYYQPVFYTGLGLNKSFLQEKLNIGFNMNNFIVKKRRIGMIKEDGSLRTMEWNKYYAPHMMFSVSYNFSTGKKQTVRKVQSIQEVQDSKIGR